MAGPTSIGELRRARRGREPWFLDVVLPQISGGKFSSGDLEVLEVPTGTTAVRISGLDQAAFEALVERHGKKFSGIDLWKCPRIQDFSPLEDLTGLEYLAIYWNQRATRLWDLSRTPNLSGLHFEDFTRLHDLEDLSRGGSLTELRFGDAVWDTSVWNTLEPLEALGGLKALQLSAKKILDARIEPLGALQGLESIKFAGNLFTTAQVAWLRARLPATLESGSLEPLRRFEKPFERDGKVLDVLLTGKRKPWLNSVQDAARIHKHVTEFERLVAAYRADPSLLPE